MVFSKDGNPVFGLPAGDGTESPPETDMRVLVYKTGTGVTGVNVSPDIYANGFMPRAWFRQLGAGGKVTGPMLESQNLNAPTSHFDVFVRRGRVVVYVDGAQKICNDFDPSLVTMSEAMVGFGQVLYHTSAEHNEMTPDPQDPNKLHGRMHHVRGNLKYFDRRDWDNLGFESGVGLPATGPSAFDETACYKSAESEGAGLRAGRIAACGAPESACPLDPDLDAADCATVASMRLTDALPPSPTNAHADDDAAANLGFKIFYDARFSTTHKVRCASCHAPETHFDDARATATGIATGTRNAPSVLGVARRTRGFFWDGRADVLWAPPILAMENPLEMGMPRIEIARAVAAYYATQYTAVFGALPPVIDDTSDPAAINRVAANVGKALEAYLRKLATGTSAFDRYLDGDRAALTPHQQRGLTVFVETGCADCHGGPLFTDDRYRDLGVPPWDGVAADPGRAAGIALERAQIFAPDGPYSDAPTPIAIPDPTAADVGAIRTPTLRNVAVTGPYMHNGRFASLADAIAFHATLEAPDLDAVVDFLGALTGSYPSRRGTTGPIRPDRGGMITAG